MSEILTVRKFSPIEIAMQWDGTVESARAIANQVNSPYWEITCQPDKPEDWLRLMLTRPNLSTIAIHNGHWLVYNYETKYWVCYENKQFLKDFYQIL